MSDLTREANGDVADLAAIRPLGEFDLVELPEAFAAESVIRDELIEARKRSRSRAGYDVETIAPGLVAALAAGTGVFAWHDTPPDRLWAVIDDQVAWHQTGGQIDLLGTVVDPDPFAPMELTFNLSRVVPSRLAARWHAGLGVSFTAIDEVDRTLAALADNLERILGIRARVDVAVLADATPIESTGHVTALVALDGDCIVGDETSVPAGTGVIVHDELVRGAHSPTLVALVRVPAVSPGALVELALQLAIRHPRLRADVPQNHLRSVESYAGSIAADPDVRANEFDILLGDDALVRSYGYHLACMPPRFTGTFADALATLDGDMQTWTVRSPLVGGYGIQVYSEDRIGLAAASKCASPDPRWMSALACTSDGTAHAFAELRDGARDLPDATLVQNFRETLAAGWLEVISP